MRTSDISDEQYLEAVTSFMGTARLPVYAFSGNVEVEMELRVAAHAVRQALRLEYQCTPGREYFDPRLKRAITGWGAATLRILVFDEGGWTVLPPSLFTPSEQSSELNEHLWRLSETDAAQKEQQARLAHGKQDN